MNEKRPFEEPRRGLALRDERGRLFALSLGPSRAALLPIVKIISNIIQCTSESLDMLP